MRNKNYLPILLTLAFSLLMITCEKDPALTRGEYLCVGGKLVQRPTVCTVSVREVTSTSAICNGFVSKDGGSYVTIRGVCWSTSQNPTIDDRHTTDGRGTGNFISFMTGLTAGTTYYVRAYATNQAGTSYGEQEIFTTVTDVPTVTTGTVSNITATSATCGGNVTNVGSSTVTHRGVCWSDNGTPSLNNNHTDEGGGTGNFISHMTGLTAGTKYYVRAYATNSAGIEYGDVVSFATNYGQPCPNAVTMTDVDGNVYNTVQIGDQCWMKENLRTTRYADGTSIQCGNGDTSSIMAYYYYPSNVAAYGLLYNWSAVMRNSSSSNTNPSGVQGICPIGWHVPSKSEWSQLKSYMAHQDVYFCEHNNMTAKALASNTDWASSSVQCAVGNTQNNNNASGFSAVPAGSFDLFYYGSGSFAEFCSSYEYGNYGAYYLSLEYDRAVATIYYWSKTTGSSVRCLRD